MKLTSEILVPRGFEFSSATAGIKVSGSPDMALALAPRGANAAAMFTTNRVIAAPLACGREHLRRTRGRVHAVVVNSGNANCATGKAGRRACEQVCGSVAKAAGCEKHEVFPASTGIIGVPLPADKLIQAIPRLFAARSTAVAGAENFARAIMTTDTRMKTASARFGNATLFGTCKGAGMIHPRLATMLVYLFTDAEASPRELGALLRDTVHVTFNRMNVDYRHFHQRHRAAAGEWRSGQGEEKRLWRGAAGGVRVTGEADCERRRGREARGEFAHRGRALRCRGVAGGEGDRQFHAGKDGVGGRRSQLGPRAGGGWLLRRGA